MSEKEREGGGRYHFSSKLQRMSVLAAVRERGGPSGGEVVALVKGSPEGLAPLLSVRPAGYEGMYRSMAENGMRVLALARRRLTAEEQAAARGAAGGGRAPLARGEVERILAKARKL